MEENHSLEQIRKKAHSLNCQLFEEGFSPRDIEIIGYYLNRIAASYLSYFTHKEFEDTFKEKTLFEGDVKETYKHL
ncbi:MAG: hypothetical protein KKC68_08720 [Candidatus Thermoplasmatota archaeon]|nr:hypothetical protein [Candidatus Thermoplasmatota archaeon]MBU1941842.1 hypothetical protein [Candidatus Thermoplasmatota archaeon]